MKYLFRERCQLESPIIFVTIAQGFVVTIRRCHFSWFPTKNRQDKFVAYFQKIKPPIFISGGKSGGCSLFGRDNFFGRKEKFEQSPNFGNEFKTMQVTRRSQEIVSSNRDGGNIFVLLVRGEATMAFGTNGSSHTTIYCEKYWCRSNLLPRHSS